VKQITEELIEEFLGDGQFTKKGDRWTVVTEHGRVFEFDDKGFDLSQCLTPLMPGETKEDREELIFGACFFYRDVWGCVDVRQLKWFERARLCGYAGGYGFTVDDNVFRPFGIVDAIVAFGDSATVRNNSFPSGWRITVPEVGFVVFGLSGDALTVLRIEGNLYGETLRFLEKWQGHAVVRGRSAFCFTCVAHGEMLGIRVIPEIPIGWFGIFLRSHLALVLVTGLCLLMAVLFPSLGLWWLVGGGWLASLILAYLMIGDDRKRGRALLNQFPQMSSRNAKIEDARERGML